MQYILLLYVLSSRLYWLTTAFFWSKVEIENWLRYFLIQILEDSKFRTEFLYPIVYNGNGNQMHQPQSIPNENDETCTKYTVQKCIAIHTMTINFIFRNRRWDRKYWWWHFHCITQILIGWTLNVQVTQISPLA